MRNNVLEGSLNYNMGKSNKGTCAHMTEQCLLAARESIALTGLFGL